MTTEMDYLSTLGEPIVELVKRGRNVTVINTTFSLF